MKNDTQRTIEKPCQQLTLRVNGSNFSIQTANEASAILVRCRELAASEGIVGASQFGGQFPIYDAARREVGYVSYNGKVWQGKRKDWKTAVSVFDPFAEGAVRA